MNKKVLVIFLGLGLLTLCAIAAGVAAYFLIFQEKELGSLADQKKFFTDAEEAMNNQDEFEITMSGEENGEAVSYSIKNKDDDSSVELKSSAFTMSFISLGDYVYLSFGGDWAKVNKSAGETYTSEFSGMKGEITGDLFEATDEDWDSDVIKYIGMEEVDGDNCHKFSHTEDGTTGYMWIDAGSKLIKKIESDEGGTTQSANFKYDNIEIKAPEDFQDLTNLSDEDANMKLYEIMGGGF